MRSRLLPLLLLPVTLLQAQVVINEIDYDQPGTDNAEFIELMNTGTEAVPLSSVAVLMYNGSSGAGVEYRSISDPSWPELAPGEHFVICGNLSLTVNCDYEASPATNLIQNGPMDAIVLISLPDSSVLDQVSYGGTLPGFSEGEGSTEIDSNTEGLLSLSRWPDGNDTDDNDADFTIACPTPGAANDIELTNCVLNVSIPETQSTPGLTLNVGRGGDVLTLGWTGMSNQPLQISIYGMNGALVQQAQFNGGIDAVWTVPVTDQHGSLLLVQGVQGEQIETKRVFIP